MRKILKIVAGHKGFAFGVAAVSVILHGLFTVADPLLNKSLIDLGLLEHRMRLFALLAGAVVVMGIAFRVGMWVDGLLMRRLQNAVTQSLTMKMLNAYYRTACPEVSASSEGYFIARIYDEPAQVAAGVVSLGVSFSVYAASLIGALAVSFYLAWRLTAVLLIVVPVLMWLAKRFQPRISQASAHENEEEARTRETLGQVVEAYKTVKLFDLEDLVVAKVYRQLAKRLGLGYNTVRTSATYETASGILLSFGEAFVLVGAAFEVINGRLSIGGLFGFMSAFWKIINAGNSLVSQYSALAKVNGQIDRLVQFEEMRKDVEEEQLCGHDAVEMKGLRVKYEDKTVFESLDMAIGPKERLVILGPNGSGKSTLANVISGFVRPAGGVLKRPRRARVAAMLTPFPFIPGTLKENVNFNRLSPEQQSLFKELTVAFELDDKGDDDLVASFSQGERKKSQIIMTLLKDADLYLFDEPFANLDVASKRTAMRIIERQTKGKALAIVMHGDDDFHGYFDRIVRLEHQRDSHDSEETSATLDAVRVGL